MDENKTYQFLIVEDNKTDAAILERIIKRYLEETFEIKTVTSLGKAISELTSGYRKFDLAFLDLNLSDSRGIFTLQSFRESCDKTPIIITSSISDENVIKKALISGASSYVVKGKDSPKEIIDEIHHVLENYVYISKQIID